MKKLIYLTLLIIAFVSCDGRDRAYMSNEAILKEDNLFKAFSQELHFIPEAPVEIVTDTLLSSGFHVKINYHSTDNNPVVYSKRNKHDSINYSHYKNFEANIVISKNEKSIVNSSLNKTLFNTFENADFWDKAIMQYVWINQEASADNYIQIHTAFHIPETEIYKDFILNIDENGALEIKEYNMTPKTI
ncbi:hypothetical protein [Aestuariibaculum suncheonense]|uniref:Uncharacterized protein n=1 Tax=Aestuariibaculum suncheonense TaxID=1028745 RepID=A0A8J6QS43_9FLAO|nr:hypothetical protein [Aestuariibaculum suncheonense]MBD0834984.1 hypothetical protein [Aestuariibaculum suncheonense]